MLQPDTRQSIDAEQSVLGGLLLDSTAMDRIGHLRPDHFASAAHSLIFQAMLDCVEVGDAIDAVTVSARVDQAGDSARIGGAGYLAQLVANTPSAYNVRRYAEIVRERATERELTAAGSRIIEASRGPMSVEEKIDYAQAQIAAISEQRSTDPASLGGLAAGFREVMQRRVSGALVGLQTHLVDLDDKLAGLHPGNLAIIAGRTSMGKTALALQIADNTARTGGAALVLSMEMAKQEIMDRLVSWDTRLPLAEIIQGTRDPNVEAALVRMAARPLFIDDTPALSVMDVRSKARNIQRQQGLALLVVDYLQLMSGQGETRNAVIEGISRGLKALAKELRIPVIALSQLSRKGDDRADRRPILSDLRDSGAIEQDADLVLFIHRESQHRPNAYEWKGLGEILIRKHRQGATGDVHVTFMDSLVRFENLAGDWPSDSGATRTVRRRAFGDE